MKTKYTIVLCLLMVASACSSFQEESVNTEHPKSAADEVFYATLEQSGAAEATKVYADENLKVLWNADDRISIYNRYTYGYQYAFQGATGKTAGAFAKVDGDDVFVVGNPLEKIYAIYPHSIDNEIDNNGNLCITWPSSQTYKAESFGIGANVMVSVTDNNQLRFRNVGGYLAIKLYGDNVSVSSITLRGNNGEKLSGRATVTCASEAEPTLTFQSASSESLRLECTSSVPIGSTAETATTFWLVVPPTEFTQGFNIMVRTSNGLVFYKSTNNAYEIERNTLCRMEAIEVIPSDIVPFADANFKAYCVANFDTDSDGEISLSEALAVTTIDVCTDNIESLQGIEFFENLTWLSCRGIWDSDSKIYYNGQLTSLDISHNTALTNLYCSGNQLSTLDVSNNSDLTYLNCDFNQLTALDVRENPHLKGLFCINNQIASLDLSQNPQLDGLCCWMNSLEELDVSHNPLLLEIACAQNNITAIDVSHNPYLQKLSFNDTFVSSIDISQNPHLKDLSCWNTPLTQLDVQNNPQLELLMCWDLNISSLDVSANPMLETFDCSPNNKLEVVYVALGQVIPGVTENRADDYIPGQCVIVEKSTE